MSVPGYFGVLGDASGGAGVQLQICEEFITAGGSVLLLGVFFFNFTVSISCLKHVCVGSKSRSLLITCS